MYWIIFGVALVFLLLWGAEKALGLIRKQIMHIPGIKEATIFGSVESMVLSFKTVSGYDFYHNLRKQYGDTIIAWFGVYPRLLTSDADLVKKLSQLLNRPSFLPMDPKKIKENPLLINLFLARHETAIDNRMIQMPAFNSQSTASYFKGVQGAVNGAVQEVEEASKQGTPFDAKYLSRFLASAAIMDATFGIKYDLSKPEEKEKVYKMVDRIKQTVSTNQKLKDSAMALLQAFISEICVLLRLDIPWFKYIKQISTMPLADHIMALVKEQQAKDPDFEVIPKKEVSKNAKGSALSDFLNWKDYEGPGLWLKLQREGKINGEKLNELMIKTNTETVFMAGYDSSAALLSMLFWVLAKYPHVEERVQQEIEEVGRNKDITYEDLQLYPYCEAVIKETLRLYTPSTSAFRSIDTPNFQINETKVPMDTVAFVSIRGLHDNPKYWKSPREFMPERFLPGSEYGPKHPYAYQPFGMSSRLCIGWRISMMKAQVTLITMAKNFKFEMNPEWKDKEMQFVTGLTSQPKNPIKLTAHKIQ